MGRASPSGQAAGAETTGRSGWLRRLTGTPALRAPLTIAACIAGFYLFPVDYQAIQLDSAIRIIRFVVVVVVLATLITRQIRAHLIEDTGKLRVESLALSLGLAIDFFAITYLRMANQMEGLHTKTDSLYFTITTVGTVGYGDIHATGQAARGVATVQILFDLMFLAASAALASATIGARLTERRERPPTP